MAILIKRMKMPKSCRECVMRESEQYEGGIIFFCRAISSRTGIGAIIDSYTRKPKWCPLTEVSEVVSGTGLHTGIYKVDGKKMRWRNE